MASVRFWIKGSWRLWFGIWVLYFHRMLPKYLNLGVLPPCEEGDLPWKWRVKFAASLSLPATECSFFSSHVPYQWKLLEIAFLSLPILICMCHLVKVYMTSHSGWVYVNFFARGWQKLCSITLDLDRALARARWQVFPRVQLSLSSPMTPWLIFVSCLSTLIYSWSRRDVTA